MISGAVLATEAGESLHSEVADYMASRRIEL
jgi:hypothetical protein